MIGSPGTQRRPDRILKNFIHPKECEHAPLIVELFLAWEYWFHEYSLKIIITYCESSTRNTTQRR